MNQSLTTVAMCVLLTKVSSPIEAAASALPGTQSLEWPEEDLSTRLMEGAHRFIDKQIQEAHIRRSRFWKYDTSSYQAYETSVVENRQRLRMIIGAVDTRLPVS